MIYSHTTTRSAPEWFARVVVSKLVLRRALLEKYTKIPRAAGRARGEHTLEKSGGEATLRQSTFQHPFRCVGPPSNKFSSSVMMSDSLRRCIALLGDLGRRYGIALDHENLKKGRCNLGLVRVKLGYRTRISLQGKLCKCSYA